MAISAKFQADFSDFQSAVQKAELSLKSFETGAGKVQTSLNKMGDAFSGNKIIQEAVKLEKAITDLGGASKLTEAEAAKVNRTITEALAKYKALGQEAPPALQRLAADTAAVDKATGSAATSTSSWMTSLKGAAGALGIAFSVGAAKQFVTQTLAAAGQIDDLSKKLGVSAEAVQRWKFAAEQGGATIDHVDKAINTMNRSLSEGNKSTIAALEAAGLSFANIRTMKPEDAFNAITGAIEKMPDPMDRARVAMELFGKGGAELLPAIVDGMQRVGDQTNVMANETVKRLADAEDAWAKLATNVTIYTGEALADVMATGDNWIKTIERMTSSWAKFAQTAQLIATGSLTGIQGLKDAMKIAAELDKAGQTASSPQQSDGDRKKAIQDAIAKAAATREGAVAAREGAKASSDYADALKRLREVIPALTAEQTKSVDAWLAQGKATKDMATVLRVNEIAIKQHIDAEKARTEATKMLASESVKAVRWMYAEMEKEGKAGIAALAKELIEYEKAKAVMRDVRDLPWLKTLPGVQLDKPTLSAQQIKDDEANARAMQRRYEETFGKLKGAANQLGVDIVGSLADGVRSGDWSQFENTMRDSLANFMGSAAAAGINALVPGLGTLLNPLLDAISDKILGALGMGTQGRDLVKDFAASFGGFDSMHKELNKLGDEGERLWINLTQGVGRNNPEQALAAIDAISKALESIPLTLEQQAAGAGFQTKAQLQAMATEAVKVHAYMRDSGLYTAAAVQAAWERANAALVKAGDEGAIAAGKAEAALAALKTELQGLEASVASEAWEEDMGVIEREQRARIENIKEEMAAREAQIEEERKAREAANIDAADHLQSILAEQTFIAKLKFDYELPDGLTVSGGVRGFAGGTGGRYLDFGAGTLAMLHGKERVMTESEGRTGGGDGGYMPVNFQVEGEVLARAMVKVRKRNGLA